MRWPKKKSRGTSGVNCGSGGWGGVLVELLSSALSPQLYVGGGGKPRIGLKIYCPPWVGVMRDSATNRPFPSLFVLFPSQAIISKGGREY